MRNGRARLVYRLRRVAAVSWTALALFGFSALILFGLFRDLATRAATAMQLMAAIVLSALLVGKLGGYVRRAGKLPVVGTARAVIAVELRDDLELGGLLLVAAYAAIQATGGTGSPLHPLAYALVAFLVAFHRVAIGAALLGLALVLELALSIADGSIIEQPTRVAAHAAFLVFFAVVHYLFLRA